MDIGNKMYRNMTIGTKVTSFEKIELQKLCEKHGVTLSEFMYHLVMNNKDNFEFIGSLSPKEEKLSAAVEKLTRELSRCKANLENADYRVSMEQKIALDSRNELDEYRYQLKEALIEIENLKEEIQEKNEINISNKELISEYEIEKKEQMANNVLFVAGGTVVGATLANLAKLVRII